MAVPSFVKFIVPTLMFLRQSRYSSMGCQLPEVEVSEMTRSTGVPGVPSEFFGMSQSDTLTSDSSTHDACSAVQCPRRVVVPDELVTRMPR